MQRLSRSIDLQRQGRAQWVIQTPCFQQWLWSSNSSALLINGNESCDGMARCSPMSLLSATLIQSLLQEPSALVINFFCGAHNSVSEEVRGPVGLLRSLNAQLLSTWQFDCGFVRFGEWMGGLRAHDLHTLGRLFRKLVGQLSNVVLFCVIDGISLFESHGWQLGTEFILRKLLDLAEDDDLDCRFKLLLTSATLSRSGARILGDQRSLSIPGDVRSDRLLTDRTIQNELTIGKRHYGISPISQTADPVSYENDRDNIFEYGCE
jgi:hypothetical protein